MSVWCEGKDLINCWTEIIKYSEESHRSRKVFNLYSWGRVSPLSKEKSSIEKLSPPTLFFSFSNVNWKFRPDFGIFVFENHYLKKCYSLKQFKFKLLGRNALFGISILLYYEEQITEPRAIISVSTCTKILILQLSHTDLSSLYVYVKFCESPQSFIITLFILWLNIFGDFDWLVYLFDV